MNIKIKEQNLRFKITEDELNSLLSGHCQHVKVTMLDKTLVVVINPQGRSEAMEVKLIQDHNEVYLNIFVPPEKLQELSDIGRNRKGIETNIKNLLISLQVDVRADSRKTMQK